MTHKLIDARVVTRGPISVGMLLVMSDDEFEAWLRRPYFDRKNRYPTSAGTVYFDKEGQAHVL